MRRAQDVRKQLITIMDRYKLEVTCIELSDPSLVDCAEAVWRC